MTAHTTHVEHVKPCPQCESEDCFQATEQTNMQGLDIIVVRDYCNPCPFQARRVLVNGSLTFVDRSDGNTMRVIIPEWKR